MFHDFRNSVGGSPTAGYLFLRGQEKVTQKKAAQARRPRLLREFPALLDQPGGLRNSRTIYTIA